MYTRHLLSVDEEYSVSCTPEVARLGNVFSTNSRGHCWKLPDPSFSEQLQCLSLFQYLITLFCYRLLLCRIKDSDILYTDVSIVTFGTRRPLGPMLAVPNVVNPAISVYHLSPYLYCPFSGCYESMRRLILSCLVTVHMDANAVFSGSHSAKCHS